VARRLVILASEDVGLADPLALPVAVAAHHAADFVGMPEAGLNLAHATLHLATAPKSNSATLGLGAAQKAIREQPVQAVPTALRDKGGQASKRAGHGKGYRYSHDHPSNISGQDYLERPLELYVPKAVGFEARIVERLAQWRELKREIQTREAERRSGKTG
jgi:putative ATPase